MEFFCSMFWKTESGRFPALRAFARRRSGPGIVLTALLSLFFAMTALAASAQISFTDPKVTVGAEVNVTMKVKSDDGTLSRANIDLVYDPSLMEFISGTDADGGSGRVRVHGGSVGSGTGVLSYNLRFRTLSAGLAVLSIETQEVYDADEALASISHQGSSRVEIVTDPVPSNVAALGALQVSPGELQPAFSPDITQYEITVGTDVNSLDIQALPVIETAQCEIEGNTALDMGESHVTVRVTAADGESSLVYDIKVMKVEGGPGLSGQGQGGLVNEGVKLYSKDKSITIMNPSENVEIPEGFQEGSIDIDHHQVRGWVWRDDEDPKYFIFYGMNNAGELYFYRYDLEEKTIQRYFEDPVAVEMKQRSEDYDGMVGRYNGLVSRYNTQFILSCVLGAATAVLLVIVLILLLRRKGTPQRSGEAGAGTSRGKGENGSAPAPSRKAPGGMQDSAGRAEGEDAELPAAPKDRAEAETRDAPQMGGDTRNIASLKRKGAARNTRQGETAKGRDGSRASNEEAGDRAAEPGGWDGRRDAATEDWRESRSGHRRTADRHLLSGNAGDGEVEDLSLDPEDNEDFEVEEL